MGRGTRLKILLGASVIGSIGILIGAHWLTVLALILVVFSSFARRKQGPPTNYKAKYGPADPDEEVITPFMPGVVLDEEDLDVGFLKKPEKDTEE